MIKGSSQQQDELYLTLPSNSSKKYYGKQETTHYFTKLHGIVTLDPSEWMVGLAEITYPKSYDSLPALPVTLLLKMTWNYQQGEGHLGYLQTVQCLQDSTSPPKI